MTLRRRLSAVAVAALAGALVTTGIPAPSYAAAPVAQAVEIMNFWYHHSSYPTRAECEEAAQEYLWPQNPGGADGYECRDGDTAWELWLMFLS